MSIVEIKKWKKFVSKKLFDDLVSFRPTKVIVEVKDGIYFYVTISTEDEYGEGIAICSMQDEYYDYDLKVGINKAMGRAVKALKTKTNDLPIRKDYEDFPNTWTKKAIERVRYMGGMYKSYYEYFGDKACEC